MSTKDLIRKDWILSGQDLGIYAKEIMHVYDSMSYELEIVDADSKWGKVRGKAISADIDTIYKVINENKITGNYTIRTIDCQKEFFLLLAQIRDEYKTVYEESLR